MKAGFGIFSDSLIDPAIPLTRPERKDVHREAWQLWLRKPFNKLLYVLVLVALVMLFSFLPRWLDSIFGYHAWYFAVAAAAIYGVVFAVSFPLLRKYNYAPHVYAELRNRGFDVCARCGYWLKGLANDFPTCPECGAARKVVRVTPFDPQEYE